ncbi:putative trans-sialidase [Trypanosoma rangeli]|uniref:Putative trans-sialidase n=1 Tax=Trypanosoma rangeli TaxID=5698 RepID=A0A3R7NCU3_TRYRA|nr:putative trans-sialidase [Trypanosoma rangeli]RNF00768.1 putative trans-sialidase [Trypanosoma rangeli]|eukprot:RNF00768.1 putative trans-sialidase [Trypanosoma rangeli]
MYRHLFASAVLLFCVLLMCGGGEAANAGKGTKLDEVELFKPGEMALSVGGEENLPALSSVFSVRGNSLVAVDGVLVAVAEAEHTASYNTDVAILVSSGVDVGSHWQKQVVFRKAPLPQFSVILIGSRGVAKGRKIFLFVESFSEPARRLKATVPSLEDSWDAVLFVGDVSAPRGGSPEARTVSWSSPRSLKDVFTTYLRQHGWTIFRAKSSGVVLGGSAIVFPLVATTAEERQVCTIFYSTDDGVTWRFPASGEAVEGCHSARLLEWEGRLLMITTNAFLRYNLHASSDMGETWTAVAGAYSNVLGDFISRGSFGTQGEFMTADIEGKRVALFITPVHVREKNSYHRGLHLWACGMGRIHDVGLIVTGVTAVNPFSSLLYSDSKLLLFYEKQEGTSSSLVLKDLSESLGRLRFALRTWQAVDARVSAGLCTSTYTAASSLAVCVGPMPTAGLVGFLYDKGDSAHWGDEYLGVNATVAGAAEKVQNGFRLTGSSARIVWPVGTERWNQRYHFADRGLTVVATVTIHKAPRRLTPLLGVGVGVGVGGRGSVQHLMLCYDEGRRWGLMHKGVTGGYALAWEEDTAYRVALTLQRGGSSVYVDGEQVGRFEDVAAAAMDSHGSLQSHDNAPLSPREEIFHLCFGDHEDSQEATDGNEVTLTGVFLYNRLLNATELKALVKEKPAPPATTEAPSTTAPPATTETLSTTAPPATTEAPSTAAPPQVKHDSSVRGCGAAVLLPLLLLGLWGGVSLV